MWYKKEKSTTAHRAQSSISCDSRGIQTHNLLIRSQMLYSVELGSRASQMRLQNYYFFLNHQIFFDFFDFHLKITVIASDVLKR